MSRAALAAVEEDEEGPLPEVPKLPPDPVSPADSMQEAAPGMSPVLAAIERLNDERWKLYQSISEEGAPVLDPADPRRVRLDVIANKLVGLWEARRVEKYTALRTNKQRARR